MNSYEQIDVRELVLLCREHDDAAFAELVRRYMPMMRKVVSGFSDVSLDPEELLQEACVALHSAVVKYDLSQESVTFGLYARICISHRMLDLVRAAKPQAVDIDSCPEERIDGESIESQLVSRETFELVMKCAREVLSDYEYKVLMLHVQGYKTAEISAIVGRDSKSVDNAKARLFRRLRGALGGMNF
ncbi:MAG: sigma-70 family RNA polymerase sigma factor [Clostridia bacterium]|nr:sigma-70 family RNA polymerase sigma factor [Clostridia bacterium]